jgi:SAM-dependent methyltransferase
MDKIKNHFNIMTKQDKLKKIVKEKYKDIALNIKNNNKSSCCESSSCCGVDYTIITDEYSNLTGYNPDADLGLGCGLPTEFAFIKQGNTVIDLGSGAGNDAFIARALVGEQGRVIGIDFTEEMIKRARENNEKLGYKNVEFIFGDIEKIPLKDNIADVVISNCVLNLVPDKEKVFKEIFRLLKPGGHFSISDIVSTDDLPSVIKSVAELYAGCISGTIKKDDYLEIIKKTGFVNIKIQREKILEFPDDLFLNYISFDEFESYHSSDNKILSINVYADKPSE